MLSISSLPGLLDLTPVKPDVSGGGNFAPLIARLLGPEIKTDCISLPAGGEILPMPMPVPAPVSLSADAPTEPPCILVVPGSPPLIDAAAPATAPPLALPIAPIPVRFAPIVVPIALAASPPPATDPALPQDATNEPRPPAGVTRAALLTTAATPMAPAPLPVRPAIDPSSPPSLSADAPVKLVGTGRKGATTEPVSPVADGAGQPTATPVDASPGPSLVVTPITPDPAQILVAPIMALPPDVKTALRTRPPATVSEASAPIVGKPASVDATPRSPAAPRLDDRAPAPQVAPSTIATETTPAIVAPAGDDARPRQTRPVEAVVAPPSPATDHATATPALSRQFARQNLRAPIAPGTDPVSIAPPVRADIAATVAPPRAVRPIAIDVRLPAIGTMTIPNATPSVVQPAPPVIVDGTRAIASPVDIRPAITAAVVDARVQAAGTAAPTPTPGDVMTPSRGRSGDEAVATIAPATERAPTAPQAAAPVILPALQAFGAAIRRAMADERKPAASGDDTILGLPTLTTTTAPATAQTVAPSDTTLDTADRRWPHAMAEQIEKLRDAADSQSTRIRLLPDALGPVDVAVRRDGEQVHVHFTAADAQTRQLLADAQPRLADAAEARGLKLGRTDVSGGDLTGGDRQQRPTAQQQQQPSRPAPARTRTTSADTDDSRLA